ncbi:hypothetical protein GJ496_011231 [Pomphorhynchus laevis]|nr:hypothetical protein GJ496_011231 [Pomphorhynchus laevis]
MDQVKKAAFQTLAPIIQPTVQSLIKEFRIRPHSADEIVERCVFNARFELQQGSLEQKSVALQKLTYLHLIGYDMSWSGFNTLEVMASSNFAQKRIGYSAAMVLLSQHPETLILAVNTCKKDLKANQWRTSLALTAIANFLCHRHNADIAINLAKQFVDDACNLLTSSKPIIRQKCILLTVHIIRCLCSAENVKDNALTVRTLMDCICERLNDTNSNVQAACISALCELSSIRACNKQFEKFISLKPSTINRLESIVKEEHMNLSNWLLIKLVKLFCNIFTERSTCSKVLDPLTQMIQSTSATSLLYECINGVITLLLFDKTNRSSGIELCARKLAILIEDSDQNLRYLGLQAMSKLYRGSQFDDAVQLPRISVACHIVHKFR